jgi:Tol biopolymer transport system component
MASRRAAFVAILLTSWAVSPDSALAQGSAGAMSQITAEPGIDIDPVVTLDGRSVVYASSRSGLLELWMRPLDGGAVSQLTTSVNNSVDRNPSLLPDGSGVLFQSDRVGGVRNIWLLGLNTRALTEITNVTDGASNPAVSPDGGTVCFTRNYADGRLAIWMVRIDGTSPREVTVGFDCAWLPTGDRVVFARAEAAGSSTQRGGIWIADADGRNAREIVGGVDLYVRSPAVAPDGRVVVYTRYAQPFSSDIAEVPGGFMIREGILSGIWMATIGEEQTAPRQLIDATAFNSFAAFGPDGRRLLFTSTRSGSADLWGVSVQR